MATTETQNSSEVGSDQISGRRKWLRRGVIVGVVLAAAGLVQLFSAQALNETERRLVGVWTYQNDPGSMVLDYRADRTMRYSPRPYKVTYFARWWADQDELVVDQSTSRSNVKYLAAQVMGGSRLDRSPVRFSEPGLVEMEATLDDGSKVKQIMIPWTGAFADKIQQVE